jgi:hypothetical protein
MRRSHLFVIVALVLIAGVASLLPAQDSPKPAGLAWEYRIVSLTDLNDPQQKVEQTITAIETRCNESGKDGWEVAATLHGAIIFKRPKR